MPSGSLCLDSGKTFKFEIAYTPPTLTLSVLVREGGVERRGGRERSLVMPASSSRLAVDVLLLIRVDERAAHGHA